MVAGSSQKGGVFRQTLKIYLAPIVTKNPPSYERVSYIMYHVSLISLALRTGTTPARGLEGWVFPPAINCYGIFKSALVCGGMVGSV